MKEFPGGRGTLLALHFVLAWVWWLSMGSLWFLAVYPQLGAVGSFEVCFAPRRLLLWLVWLFVCFESVSFCWVALQLLLWYF